MVIDKPSFQLFVTIEYDLDQQAVRKILTALSASGSEDLLKKKDRRSGVSWNIEFEREDRPEILTQKLTDLGEGVARAIANVTNNFGGVVGVSLCQDIDDVEDPQQMGIWFSEDFVRWVALSGGMIGIDQYIYTD